ncbi:MAG: aa3-type cytochrome c oxidase subunit IV [Brevundimonas sp.]|uniref:aa3-type cytochrome c oxidase subunit IV n=1 Tax=Brevundimonas sp. TaxID=1871086 RepID=UPI0025BC85BC|nr:aa3-type cytochrome c oxidase subunit IV [Brevundimonas sp.]MBX3476320.1 aa3-type cytochrome c oxidase subunit IV [Brevundimonas sp.]
MAGAHHTDDYQRGSQEISEQVSTWALFMVLFKWSCLATAVIVLFLTLWFQPGGSFIAGLIAAVVVSVAGWFLLRSKPAH